MTKALFFLVVLAAACRTPTDPPSLLPRVGAYAYESAIAGARTMTITTATANRLAVQWGDARTAPSAVRDAHGAWDGTAYVVDLRLVHAVPAGVLITDLVHRLSWQGGRFACVVRNNAETATRPCALTYQGN